MHNLARGIARGGSASHGWIALLRMIEGCARGWGVSFRELRAALEREVPLGSRPDMATIKIAAARLLAAHERRLAARKQWIALRRAEKRGGKRSATRQRELLALEAKIGQQPVVHVGYWGWRRRAQEGSGAGVSGPLGGRSGLAM
ncbi:hypothetical protein [Nannocystis sp.]|uniref:hypothetical protein n=1 Tax=Nannocystis sp. TaxID=1962667 RepID=UPI0025D5D212|nr:hypothetical protein [Nannocystis sp.]MBK7824784.1 hypothetical protein [Nannocystis sp.]